MLQMDPVTRSIQPTDFEGVKLVSFGWAGQGSAIMRGPMVSGARSTVASYYCSALIITMRGKLCVYSILVASLAWQMLHVRKVAAY